MLTTLFWIATESIAAAQIVPQSVWPMYQYRPDHNAVFDSPDWNANWRFDTGGRIGGGLSIVGNAVYFESFDKNVYALNALTGKELWHTTLPNIAMNSPIVVNGVVYVGTGNNSILVDNGSSYISGIPEGDYIYALDAATGAVRWRFHTVGEDMPTGAATAAGTPPAFLFSNGDGRLRALNALTGRLLWNSPMNGSTSMGSLAEVNGIAYGTSQTFAKYLIASFGNKVAMSNRSWTWAVREGDGQYLWTSPYGSEDCSPTVGRGKVFVEATQFPPGEGVTGTNWYSEVDALEAVDGSLAWQYKSGAGPLSTVGSLENAIAGLYAQGNFYESLPYTQTFDAFDAATGKIRWQTPVSQPVKMSAIEYRGVLYFGDTGGTLYAIDARSGNLRGKTMFSDPFTTSPPVIVGGTLFFANGDSVYATPLSTIAHSRASSPSTAGPSRNG